MRSLLGKYRDLVFAIALFLVLDLGILMFNFYTSREIEREAGRINTAGELRMLTQQMTKSLLSMHLEVKTGLPIQTSMAQLSEAHGQFERGLARLSGGLGQDQAGAAYLITPRIQLDGRVGVCLNEAANNVIVVAGISFLF